jgi:predicted O-methyltransferase YrrM
VIRSWLRRIQLGIPTLLGWRRLGYFIPYRYAAGLPDLGESPGYLPVQELMCAKEQAFTALLQAMENYQTRFETFNNSTPPIPRWQQDWFPRLDGLSTYTMIRDLKPAHIVEVGTGHSTRFMAQAVEDGAIDCKITTIDPAPRADIAGIETIDLIRQPIQNVGTAAFEDLKSGDVLFVDSSHILMPGSDVDLLFNRIMPTLPGGVHIHIHDITLPDDYPKSWSWRGYNEQQGLMPMILGGGYDLLWSSYYVATTMNTKIETSFIRDIPLADGAIETSVWLKKL